MQFFNIGSNVWQTADDAAGRIVDKRLYTLNSDKTITKTDNYSEGPDYYITGDKGLVGENWGQTPSSGQMTLDSGTTYTKTFSNVAAGSYEFRITSSDDNELTSGWSSYSDYTITTSDNDDILTVSQSQSDSNNVKMSLSDPADITITFNTTQSSSKYPVTITATKNRNQVHGNIPVIIPMLLLKLHQVVLAINSFTIQEVLETSQLIM